MHAEFKPFALYRRKPEADDDALRRRILLLGGITKTLIDVVRVAKNPAEA